MNDLLLTALIGLLVFLVGFSVAFTMAAGQLPWRRR